MDDAARQRFEELMDELRQQLMQSYFNQMSEGMQDVSPEQMARMKDMLADLNQMLEQRERGEEPDFDGFMEKYGDFFPGNPKNLDELLEQMARSMAAMQQMMNSMTPEQRAQLQGLAQALLEDMDLRWQMDELSRNLQQAFPDMPWNQQPELPRRRPDAVRADVGRARDARRPRPAREHAEERDPARPARRGRHRPGPRPARRGLRPLARTAAGAREDPRGGRAHRPARGSLRADARRASAPSVSRRSATCSAR